jgi:hypothetical protein
MLQIPHIHLLYLATNLEFFSTGMGSFQGIRVSSSTSGLLLPCFEIKMNIFCFSRQLDIQSVVYRRLSYTNSQVP